MIHHHCLGNPTTPLALNTEGTFQQHPLPKPLPPGPSYKASSNTLAFLPGCTAGCILSCVWDKYPVKAALSTWVKTPIVSKVGGFGPHFPCRHSFSPPVKKRPSTSTKEPSPPCCSGIPILHCYQPFPNRTQSILIVTGTAAFYQFLIHIVNYGISQTKKVGYSL